MSSLNSENPTPNSAEDNLPHRPADDSEEVYYAGSPLLRGEVGRLLLVWMAGVILILIPIFGLIFHWSMNGWVGLSLVVIGLIVILVPVIITKTVSYRISNYRIDYERGLLSKNIDTLELWHVEDIKFHQSLLDRIVNVGTITIVSHDDTTPNLIMHGLPNPRPLFETLKQRVIAVKRQRGVIKMDTGN